MIAFLKLENYITYITEIEKNSYYNYLIILLLFIIISKRFIILILAL